MRVRVNRYWALQYQWQQQKGGGREKRAWRARERRRKAVSKGERKSEKVLDAATPAAAAAAAAEAGEAAARAGTADAVEGLGKATGKKTKRKAGSKAVGTAEPAGAVDAATPGAAAESAESAESAVSGAAAAAAAAAEAEVSRVSLTPTALGANAVYTTTTSAGGVGGASGRATRASRREEVERWLVVVESPSKARTIQGYLQHLASDPEPPLSLVTAGAAEGVAAGGAVGATGGTGGVRGRRREFSVLATHGHVRDVPNKVDAVSPEADFAIDWRILPQAVPHFRAIALAAFSHCFGRIQAVRHSRGIALEAFRGLLLLKGAAAAADFPFSSLPQPRLQGVVLATDADREGEAIVWHVYQLLKGAAASGAGIGLLSSRFIYSSSLPLQISGSGIGNRRGQGGGGDRVARVPAAQGGCCSKEEGRGAAAGEGAAEREDGAAEPQGGCCGEEESRGAAEGEGAAEREDSAAGAAAARRKAEAQQREKEQRREKMVQQAVLIEEQLAAEAQEAAEEEGAVLQGAEGWEGESDLFSTGAAAAESNLSIPEAGGSEGLEGPSINAGGGVGGLQGEGLKQQGGGEHGEQEGEHGWLEVEELLGEWLLPAAGSNGCDLTIHRATFHEITPSAVLSALSHPRLLSQPLVDAYFARRVLDFLMGFNLSPVLWRKLPGCKSAGRVQSVALRFVCEREGEVAGFNTQEYWTVSAMVQACQTKSTLLESSKGLLERKLAGRGREVGAEGGVGGGGGREEEAGAGVGSDAPLSFPARLTHLFGEPVGAGAGGGAGAGARRAKETKEGKEAKDAKEGKEGDEKAAAAAAEVEGGIRDGERALAAAVLVEGSELQVQGVHRSQTRRSPSPPFTTSSMQQEASSKLGLVEAPFALCILQKGGCTVQANAFLLHFMEPYANAFLLHFMEPYVNAGFTAQLESKFDDVAAGEEDWRQVLRTFWTDFQPRVEEMHKLSPQAVSGGEEGEGGLGSASDVRRWAAGGSSRDVLPPKSFPYSLPSMPYLAVYLLFPQVGSAVQVTLGDGLLVEAAETYSEVLAKARAPALPSSSSSSPSSSSSSSSSPSQSSEPSSLSEAHESPPSALSTPSHSKTCPSCGSGELEYNFSSRGVGLFVGCSAYPTCHFKARVVEQEGKAGTLAVAIDPVAHIIGEDPSTGAKIWLKVGPYGAYVERSSYGKVSKVNRASLPPGTHPDAVDLPKALELLAFPRTI
ncbi:unnamed protein product, partial [Closterium sp. Naga37s-1]